MHIDIAYNSLPVSELLAEFDERWPLPLPDADNVQELVDRLLGKEPCASSFCPCERRLIKRTIELKLYYF
ncbi:hypothetical protein [uncultured Bilophila sp.]|uniref:hypothetical protein n=1 Tax=uncultured Bilophila sp. TaxID=529385 RepID=UPI00280BA7BE|nr:hypothetical protein [uncultured Bilophila sp.]